ncbi:VanW family protein [Desulfofundulus sp. TPOSR]|uniref:VanW family protein n=1 Tax=Desulfofundulus sp. TPOSR TaxID=2714340 RepID=UPI0028BEE333|nr:VanW family protein [Desulfofundulus sp. TPOSR]
MYGYVATGSVCPACWKFVAIGALLAVFYLISPGKQPGRMVYVSAGPARALAVVSLALLIVNPGTEPVAVLPATASHSDSIKKAGPDPVEKTASYKLRVSTPDGKETYLDLREKPALFFAAWCPHCPEALKDAARLLPGKRPYLIVTYLREGDIGKAKEKLAENGLTGEPCYLVEKPPKSVQEVPALVWMEGSELRHVEGAGAIAEKLRAPKLLGSAEIPNPPDGGGENAALAASLINGKVVQPGEVFSFNRAVGPRTVSRGFVEGRSVVETVYGPKTVPDVGGGVCRASTALHLAVLNAGLEVVERHSHSMPVSYAEPGKDAAVAWPYWDLRFRNTVGKTLVIKTSNNYGKLRVELWVYSSQWK